MTRHRITTATKPTPAFVSRPSTPRHKKPCSKRQQADDAPKSHARGSKVENVFVPFKGPLHAQESPSTWEDTHWKLPPLFLARKRRKIQTTEESPPTRKSGRKRRFLANDSSTHCCPKAQQQKRTMTSHEMFFRIPLLVPKVRIVKTPVLGHRAYSASPYVLYRWLRVRLAEGLIRSSFDVLHRILQNYYGEARKVFSELDNDPTQKDKLELLFDLRDRLAGIWCVYSHFSLEVGCIALARLKRRSSQKNAAFRSYKTAGYGNDRNIVTFDDVSNHAIWILLTARDCPLVGSHTGIAVSLGRLMVSATAVEHSKPYLDRVELPREEFLAKIRSAIDACWDNMEVCKSNLFTRRRIQKEPTPNETITLLAGCEDGIWESLNTVATYRGVKSTLLLPKLLQNSLRSTNMLSDGLAIADKNAVRCLCKELNRWSRLEEVIKLEMHRKVRVAPSCHSCLTYAAEELSLFAVLEIIPDPLNHFYEVGRTDRQIVWQW